jgi:hypothetical protein
MSKTRKRIKQSSSSGAVAIEPLLARITEPPIQISNRSELPSRLSSLSIDYQMTVRFRISEIQRREVSLLLSVLNYKAVHFGVNFGDYLGIQHCVEFLIGNKEDPWEIKDPKERVTTLSSMVILKSLRGQPLFLEDLQNIDPEVSKEISDELLISSRQYGSLKQHYNANRYLELLAVPLDVFYERRTNAKRYDSYTKGYKDGGSAAARKKTRYSYELDGEDSEQEMVFPLLDYRKYQTINFISLKRKPLKR